MNKRSMVIAALALGASFTTAAPSALKDLQGEWMFGALSFTNYRDAISGRLVDDGGNIGDRIKILENGSYERAARSKFTLSTCTTRLAIWEKGKLEVLKDRITFRPNDGSVRSEDNCNAKFNYTNPVMPWTRAYAISRDSYGRIGLSLRAEDGSSTLYLRQLKAGL
jgi:hypothetical protein